MARDRIVSHSTQPGKERKNHKDKERKKKQNLKTPKKELLIGPRLRLEPRLSPIKSPIGYKGGKSSSDLSPVKARTTLSPVKARTTLSSDKARTTLSPVKARSTLSPVKKCVKSVPSNDFVQGIKMPDTINFEGKTNENFHFSIPSDTDNSYTSVRHKIGVLKSCPVTTQVSTSSSSKIKFKRILKKKTKLRRGLMWSDKELLDLATALQKHGFKDTGKIAEYVKTKNENQIKDYIRLRQVDVRSDVNAEKLEMSKADEKNPKDDACKTSSNVRGRPFNKWSLINPDHLQHWPSIRKWRRLAFEQMLACSKRSDYSVSVIISLLNRFYEEEEEPSDPQVINVKAIYKYLLDSLSDEIPGQLPPKESALMMDLLKDLRLLPMVYDFDEDTKFLESYKEATRYKPFQVKDEFRRKFIKRENTEDSFSANCISVPEEIFTNLSRHKKVVQSFNPLMIPVWMMQKAQEYMEQIV